MNGNNNDKTRERKRSSIIAVKQQQQQHLLLRHRYNKNRHRSIRRRQEEEAKEKAQAEEVEKTEEDRNAEIETKDDDKLLLLTEGEILTQGEDELMLYNSDYNNNNINNNHTEDNFDSGGFDDDEFVLVLQEKERKKKDNPESGNYNVDDTDDVNVFDDDDDDDDDDNDITLGNSTNNNDDDDDDDDTGISELDFAHYELNSSPSMHAAVLSQLSNRLKVLPTNSTATNHYNESSSENSSSFNSSSPVLRSWKYFCPIVSLIPFTATEVIEYTTETTGTKVKNYIQNISSSSTDSNNNNSTINNNIELVTTVVDVDTVAAINDHTTSETTTDVIVTTDKFIQHYYNPQGYEGAFGVALAIRHLNRGDDSIVENVKNLNGRCPIKFGSTFVDTNFDSRRSFEIVDEFTSTGYFPFNNTNNNNDDNHFNNWSNNPNNNDDNGIDNNNNDVCAFLGAYDSEVSKSTGGLSTIRGVPQISGQSMASELDDPELFGLFARTIPNEKELAYHLVQYLYSTLQLRYCVIMYTNGSYGHSFVRSIRNAVRDLNPLTLNDDEFTIRYIVFDDDGDGIIEGIKELKRSEYRFIVAILRGRQLHDTLMYEAYKQQVAGDGIHNWMFVDGYSAVLEGRLFDYNSPLERAYRGTGTVKASGGDVHSEKHIEFHNQMLALQDEYYRKSSSWLPNYDGDVDNNDMEKTSRTELLHPFHYENYDWSHLEDNGYDAGSFMYEATILLGLAACDEFNYQINKIQQQRQQILKEKQQEKEQQEYNNSTDASEAATEKELYQEDIVKLLGDDFYRRIVQTTFEGISGPVILDQTTGTRMPNTTSYRIVNYVERVFTNATNNTDGTYTPNRIEFVPITTSLYRSYSLANNATVVKHNSMNTTTTSEFSSHFPGEWVKAHPYTYNSGQTKLPEPGDLPPSNFDLKTVSFEIRCISWIMVTVTLILGVGFTAWTYKNRKTRIVRASQPFFLYLLVAGQMIFISSIIPLTIFHVINDNSTGQMKIKSLNEQRAEVIKGGDPACTSVIWFLSLGLAITYSALFAKTYRINKIMNSAKKFRKIKLTVKDTLKPVIAVFICNIIVLITMSVVTPIHYNYFVEQYDVFGRPLRGYAYCDFSNPNSLPCIIALAVIDIGIMFLATYQAWGSRNLATEYSETKSIFSALIVSLFSCILGAPVLALVAANPDASAFITSVLLFEISLSILWFTFVPKIKYQMKPDDEAKKRDSRSSGMVILTTKTPRELLQETHLLKGMLFEKERLELAYNEEIDSLKEQVSDLQQQQLPDNIVEHQHLHQNLSYDVPSGRFVENGKSN